MKYCTHCGKEVNDDAVICVNCGETIQSNLLAASNPKNKTTKIIILSVICVVLVAVAVFCTIFMPKVIRAKKIEENLVDKTLSYYHNGYRKYKFKSNNKVNIRYYYYNVMDESRDYDSDYKVEVISDDEVLLKIGINEFILNLNYNDRVNSMIDTENPNEVYK